MSQVIDQVAALLRARLTEIDKEQAQLHRTLGNLDGTPGRAPRKPTSTPKRKRSPKRAKKGQRRKEVLTALTANPKAKTSEIARQIGISSNQVSGLRKQLAASAQLKAPARKQKPKRAKRKTARSTKAAAKAGAKKAVRKSSKGKVKAKVSKASKSSSPRATGK